MTTIFEEYIQHADTDDNNEKYEEFQYKISELMETSGCDMKDIDLKVYYKDNIYSKPENRIKLTFSEAEFEEVSVYAQNPKNDKELTDWISAYYNQNKTKWMSEEYWCLNYKFYNRMIDEAIKSNNQKGVEILFKSISYYDRDYPDYEHAIEVAAEYGNMIMFSYVLYMNLFAHRLNGREHINKKRLIELSEKNSHIETRNFIAENIKPVEMPWIFE